MGSVSLFMNISVMVFINSGGNVKFCGATWCLGRCVVNGSEITLACVKRFCPFSNISEDPITACKTIECKTGLVGDAIPALEVAFS